MASHSLPLRRRPDARAPSTWSPALIARLQSLARLLVYPLLPLYALRWIFNPRGQSFRTYLGTRVAVWVSHLVPLFSPPQSLKAAAALCPPDDVYVPLDRGAWIDARWDVTPVPAAPEDMLGGLATGPGCVKPEGRPGFMITPEGARGQVWEKARAGEKIILFIHGGGYVRGHPLWTPFPLKLAKEHRVRAFLCQYRKTLTPETAWPAPLQDALAAWHYVAVTLGFPPASILLMGESAGGHLSLALVQQLAALSRPQPGGIALVSPWADFTCSFPSWTTKAGLDHLSRRKLGLAIQSCVRHYAKDALPDPLFSPALAKPGHWGCLAGTPVFVSVGTDEVFVDEDRALVRGMRRDGVDVELFEDKHGLHDGPITMLSVPGTYERFSAGVADLLRAMSPSQSPSPSPSPAPRF